MRIAFVSPLPPAPTGIADYSADVLRLLASRHEIDVVALGEGLERASLPASCGVVGISDFPARHRARPWDVVVHQLGNGPAHDPMWPLLAAAPGLLVLHDLVLYHARARMFLDAPEVRAYAADPGNEVLREAAEAPRRLYAEELRYSYPGQGDRLHAVQLGTTGRLLPYAYPLFRLPVEASRAVAVHNHAMAAAVRDEVPDTPVHVIPMLAEPMAVEPGARARVRERLGFAPADVVVGCFGLVTPEKQPLVVARAVARAAAHVPGLRLLLVGPVASRDRLDRDLGERGMRARTTLTGRVDFAELGAHLEAADIVVHLRYPTARETSAALLRILAQGRPTVMSDLENLAEIPEDAVLRADLADEEGDVTRAILRLAGSPALRERLGDAGRRFVRDEHSAARCLAGYEDALRVAASRVAPVGEAWPAHWRFGR